VPANQVDMAIPLKQGLKRNDFGLANINSTVDMAIPLKQGLKQINARG